MCKPITAQVETSKVPENTVHCSDGSVEELVNDIYAHAKEAAVESLSPDASKSYVSCISN